VSLHSHISSFVVGNLDLDNVSYSPGGAGRLCSGKRHLSAELQETGC
jgi:hypothetical protein